MFQKLFKALRWTLTFLLFNLFILVQNPHCSLCSVIKKKDINHLFGCGDTPHEINKKEKTAFSVLPDINVQH